MTSFSFSNFRLCIVNVDLIVNIYCIHLAVMLLFLWLKSAIFQRSTIPKVRYSKSLLFPLTLSLILILTLILTLNITLTLTLTQTLALWRVSAQWTFGIVDLWNSGPVLLQISLFACLPVSLLVCWSMCIIHIWYLSLFVCVHISCLLLYGRIWVLFLWLPLHLLPMDYKLTQNGIITELVCTFLR